MASRTKRRRRAKPQIGAMPGTLVIDPQSPQPTIRVMAYGPDGLVEKDLASSGQIRPFLQKHPVTWVDVKGLGSAEALQALGDLFGVHRLALEDVVNVHQRAKVEEYDDHLFLVARMAGLEQVVNTEQLSLFLGKNFVLTFQERPGQRFDGVRERIRHGRGRIRRAGADYLAYALIDALVDAYFPVVESYSDRLEGMEEETLAKPADDTLARIHEMKRDLVALRRAVSPLREAVNSLLRDSGDLIHDETQVYLRDCYDHVIRVADLIETGRELCADLMNLYLTSVSNRMNEVMRVLTVIATIFIPLTFIAGIYGMNFNAEKSVLNMPELNWTWGYPICLAVMLAVTIAMLAFFRRKGWLGGTKS